MLDVGMLEEIDARVARESWWESVATPSGDLTLKRFQGESA